MAALTSLSTPMLPKYNVITWFIDLDDLNLISINRPPVFDDIFLSPDMAYHSNYDNKFIWPAICLICRDQFSKYDFDDTIPDNHTILTESIPCPFCFEKSVIPFYFVQYILDNFYNFRYSVSYFEIANNGNNNLYVSFDTNFLIDIDEVIEYFNTTYFFKPVATLYFVI